MFFVLEQLYQFSLCVEHWNTVFQNVCVFTVILLQHTMGRAHAIYSSLKYRYSKKFIEKCND